MKHIVTSNNKETDLYSFIHANLISSDYTEFRDVDSLTGIISNLLENQSRLLEILFEKGIISERELKQLLNRSDFKVKKEEVHNK